MKSKSKKQSRNKGLPNVGELKKCKHCGKKLNNSDIKKLEKEELPGKYGLMWTGIEFPFIQHYKIHCSDMNCEKSYTVKHKGARWFYK